MPKAMRIGLLVDPTNIVNTETAVRDAEDAARSMGLKIQVLNASTPRDIDAAFAAIVSERLDALFVDLIPTPDQIELAMYGNDVMDLTSSGLRSI
jgi:hypothetical protein